MLFDELDVVSGDLVIVVL
jgi:hypothetical protein